MSSFSTLSNSRGVRRGFTLVETLLAVAVCGILLFALVEFFIGYYRSYGYLSATMDVAGSASVIVAEATQAIRQADQIVASRTFTHGGVLTTGANTIVLRMPSIDVSGNILAGKYDYVAFYSAGTKAYRSTEADAASARGTSHRMLSDTLQSLSFTYNNGNLAAVTKVDVEVMTQKQVRGQLKQRQLRQQVYLRNK